MGVIASSEGGYRCRVTMRGFEIVVDEPLRDGGTDEGPMPTELFLASLASCYAVSLAYVARKKGVELAEMSVEAEGEYDGPRFASLRLTVRSSHPRPELDELVARAAAYCYVSNTLRRPPEVEVRLGGVPPSHRPPPGLA